MSHPLARAGLAAGALLVMVFLAVSLHNARLLGQARELSTAQRADTARGIDLARRADLLNPDYTERGTLVALFHARQGRLGAARRDIEAVIRREPENPGAWVILAGVTRESDPALSARARARARRLSGL